MSGVIEGSGAAKISYHHGKGQTLMYVTNCMFLTHWSNVPTIKFRADPAQVFTPESWISFKLHSAKYVLLAGQHSDVEAAFASIRQQLGNPSVLIYNAGPSIGSWPPPGDSLAHSLSHHYWLLTSPSSCHLTARLNNSFGNSPNMSGELEWVKLSCRNSGRDARII